MKTITLGHSDLKISTFGLGCMGMSDFYGTKETRNDNESIRTIHAAIDAGINFFNTGDFYGMGHNELLLGQALKGKREKTVISAKFGALRGPNGEWFGFDGRPAAVKNFLAYTLNRLGTDYVDIYQPARIDPNVPIEETVGAIADLIKQGKVRYLGLSEAPAEQIKRAHKTYPVSALEIEYSIASRVYEKEIKALVSELGITTVAYGAIGRGLLSGTLTSEQIKQDTRAHSPRFTGENYQKNLILIEKLNQFAKQKNCTPAQLALAWVAAQGINISTLIGTKKTSRLAENLKAQDIQFSAADLKDFDQVFFEGSFSGDRYPKPQMNLVVR